MLPPQAYIDKLKREHGSIFAIDNYIVRKLTLGEFDAISSLDSVDAEEYIVDSALLWPEDADKIPAGHVSSLADDIIELSGFMDPATILEEARNKSKQIKNMMYAFVLATQEKYTEEDLDKLTFSQLAEKVALAENIIEIQKAIYDPTVDMRLVISEAEEGEEPHMPPGPSDEEWDQASQGAYYNPDKASTFGAASTQDPIAQQLKAAMG